MTRRYPLLIPGALAVLSGTASAERTDWPAEVDWAKGRCEADAATLRNEAQGCRSFLAENAGVEGATCTITVTRNDGSTRELSIDEAEGIAGSWDANAARLAGRLTDVRDHWDRMLADEAAIRALGFARLAEEFAEWERASAELHGEAIKLTVEGLWDALNAGAGKTKDFLMGLNRREARAVAKHAEELGITDPFVLDGIRKLNRIKSHKKRLERAAEIVERLEKVKDLILMEGETGDFEAAASRVMTIAGWFNKNPFTKVVVADVRLAASLVWGSYTEEAIDGLARLTEADLQVLHDRSESAKYHLARIQSLVVDLEPCFVP